MLHIVYNNTGIAVLPKFYKNIRIALLHKVFNQKVTVMLHTLYTLTEYCYAKQPEHNTGIDMLHNL